MRFCTHCGSSLDVPLPRFCTACGGALADAGPAAGGSPSLAGLRGWFGASAETISAPTFRAALIDGLVPLAVVLVATTVVVGVLGVSLATTGHHGSPADWWRAAVLLVGLAVHGTARLTAGSAPDSGGLDVTVMPLLLSGLAFLVVYTVSRVRSRSEVPATLHALLAGSAGAGVAFAIGFAILAAVSHGRAGFGVDLTSNSTAQTVWGADPWRALPGAFVLAGLGTFLGRLPALARSSGVRTGRRWLADRLGTWRDDVAQVCALLLGALVVTILIACVLGGLGVLEHLQTGHALSGAGTGDSSGGSASGDISGGRSVILGLLVIVLMAPNIVVVAVGMTLGGTAQGHLTGDLPSLLNGFGGDGMGLLAGGVAPAAYLAVPLMLVVSMAIGVRYALRVAPEVPRTRSVWRPVGVSVLAWLVLVVVVQMSAGAGTGGLTTGGAIGLGYPSVLAAALVWSLVSAVGGRLIASSTVATFPRASVWLAGGRCHHSWALLAADATIRSGRSVPLRLEPAAARLTEGEHPDVPPLRVRPGRGGIVLGLAGVLVVVVVGGVVGYGIAASRVFGPERTVEEYFAALHSGNASRALAQVDPASLRGVNRTLLTDDTIKHPPSIRTSGLHMAGESATVRVDESFGQVRRTATLRLHRSGHRAGIFPRWRLTAPFTDLEIDVRSDSGAPTTDTVTINGGAVSDSPLPVFPGTYTATVDQHGVFTGTGSSVYAPGSGNASVSVRIGLNQNAGRAADEAVHALVDRCARSTEAAPPNCPFTWYDHSLKNVRWTVIHYPTVELSVLGSDSITVLTTKTGTVHLSARSADPFLGPSTVSEDLDVYVDGKLDWDGVDPVTARITRS